MRTNLPKLLQLLIFYIYSLNFSLEFFIMIFFVTNQLNISKFLPNQIRKTLISYYIIGTKFYQFSKFLLIVCFIKTVHRNTFLEELWFKHKLVTFFPLEIWMEKGSFDLKVVSSRVSEIKSWYESAIFFTNLAYILHIRLPYPRHYNPRFVYFLPHFWRPKTFFKELFL